MGLRTVNGGRMRECVTENGAEERKRFHIPLYDLATAVILALALFWRIGRLFGGLEYDEIWTLTNFSIMPVSEIFTRLALPNNHPLNTLLVKIFYFGRECAWTIRLVPLFCGIGTVWLTGVLAKKLFGRTAGVIAMFFTAFSAPLIYYSQTARGYSMQLFLLLVFAICVFSMNKTDRPEKCSFLPEAGALLSGAAAVLALSTSAIYLSLISLAALVSGAIQLRHDERSEKLRKMWSLVTLALLGMFILVWGTVNFRELAAGRSWGTPVGSLHEYLKWSAVTLEKLGIGIVAVIAAAAALWNRKSRKNAACILVMMALILFSALFTNAGPERTYLVLVLCGALLYGAGAETFCTAAGKSRRVKLLVCAAFGAVASWNYASALKYFSPADFAAVGRECSALPEEILIVHRAAAGYPLDWNCGKMIRHDTLKRVAGAGFAASQADKRGGLQDRLLLLCDNEKPGMLEGIGSGGATESLRIAAEGKRFDGESFSGEMFRLKMLKDNEAPFDGEVLLAVIAPVNADAASGAAGVIAASGSDLMVLNPWLTYPMHRPDGTPMRYRVMVCRADAAKWRKSGAERLLQCPFLTLYRIAPLHEQR